MRNYESIFAPFMQRLITIKRGLGFKCIDMEYAYLMFDRFILSESVSSVGITRELAEKWSAPRANESQRTRYVRIAHVAQLCHFLCTLGYKSHIPRLPRIQRSHVPYIFSREQVAAFFAASDRIMIKCSRHETSISAVPALFRMLYSTGMRLEEALALRDVDVATSGPWRSCWQLRWPDPGPGTCRPGRTDSRELPDRSPTKLGEDFLRVRVYERFVGWGIFSLQQFN